MRRMAIGLLAFAVVACDLGPQEKREYVSFVYIRDAAGRCVELSPASRYLCIVDDKHCSAVER